MKKPPTNIQFANAGEATLFGFINEITPGDDGWMMIAPLGDFASEALMAMADGKLKKQRAIQRITRETAETMVAQFHNSRRGFKKFFRGTNVYVGHPDMPGLEKRYPDKEPKGVFTDMQVRDKGIYGLPIFTNEGMDLVEGRKLVSGQRVRGLSGRLINSVPDGESNGVPVFCPTEIASAGLTPYPHLPVEFFNSDNTLADEAEQTQPNKQMKKKLIALLAALSIKPQFANATEPTEGETEAAVDLINAKVAEFANSQTTLKQKLLALCKKVGITFANEAEITDPAATVAQVEGKIATMETDMAAAKTATTSAQTQFANERTERINDELAHAIESGRITDAEKPTWLARLNVQAQFANERTALRALTQKVKTASVTLNHGGRETQVDVADPRARRQFINEVQGEIAAELKLDPVKDAKKIQGILQQRHPALFKDIPHVEIKMPGARK